MTHPLFAGTPVDDLPSELQWIIASYFPRHPVASLADDMITMYLTRTDRSWLYGPIFQTDLYCTNLYRWNEEGVGYRFDRSDRMSDLRFSTDSMWGRVPPDRPIKESEVPRRRLLKGVKVKRGLTMYQLRLTLTGNMQPVRR
jgi:hypothetical protein